MIQRISPLQPPGNQTVQNFSMSQSEWTELYSVLDFATIRSTQKVPVGRHEGKEPASNFNVLIS